MRSPRKDACGVRAATRVALLGAICTSLVSATAWAQGDEEPGDPAGAGGAGAKAPEEPDGEPDEPEAPESEPEEPTDGAAEPVDEPPPEPEAADVDETAAGAEASVELGEAGEGAAAAGVTADADAEEVDAPHVGAFSFGSYGRVIAATDARGGPGRDADIVAHGSRLDESNYVELELRRDDEWAKTGASTRLVATLAIAHPVFHYDGEFDIDMAVRNLYLQTDDLGLDGLRVWAGSRMLRGDDIYLLDFWPLDNLNTLGAGVGFNYEQRSDFELHGGLSRPDTPFYHQSVDRPRPLNQLGATRVEVLNRQRFIGSLRASHIVNLGKDGAGVKGVAYGEMHQLPSGQRETEQLRVFEEVPSDDGYVIGGEISAFSGSRDTHVNLFVRYATGLAAYGQFATPGQLGLDRTTSGAHELLVAAGGNWELGPVGVMLGAYFRSFRDASDDLNFEDVDEGIVAARPHFFFGELGGVAVEGSYQVAQRGVLWSAQETTGEIDTSEAPTGPHTGRLFRLGFVPFVSPAGRGDFSRPQLRFIWALTFRDEGAKAFYPQDDVFGLRDVEHFIGVGAEWWFNSSSYGG